LGSPSARAAAENPRLRTTAAKNYGAKRLVAFVDEGPECIRIFPEEVEDIASLAEIGSLGSHQQCPDVALASFVNGLLQRIGEFLVDQVLWRVGQHDVTNGILLLECDDLHFNLP
jgi:hypothetical protein